MSRYIDADDLIKTLEEKLKEGIFQSYVLSACRGAINKQPTADVVKVVHGEWSRTNNRPKTYIRRCSVCNMESYNCLSEKEYNYCPWCGAKMDEKKVE